MKKLTFLVFYKEYDKFLDSLRNLGVVHIQKSADQSAAENFMNDIRAKQEELKDLDRVINGMQTLLQLEELPIGGDADGAVNYVIQADGIIDALNGNAQYLKHYQDDYQLLKPWGAYDHSLVARLEEQGIKLTYYKANSAFFKSYPQYAEYEVSHDESNVYFVVYSPKDEVLDVPATIAELPSETLEQCQKNIENISEQTAVLLEQQKTLAEDHLADIVAYRSVVRNQIATLQVRMDTASVADEKVMVVEGWYPVVSEKKIESYLQSVNTYYEVREPESSDDVPIQLHNNWFTRQFEVLTGMYGMPNYTENDPTPIISIFYTLFFSICMGDCGYGILLILFGRGVAAGKIKGGMLDMFKGLGGIITILGCSTLVVGFFLGTFMGVNMYEATWVPDAVKSLMAPFQGSIAGFSTQMVMALTIGIIHIILAMTIKTITFTKNQGVAATVSLWGWLLLIVGCVVCAILGGVKVLDEQTMKWAFIGVGGVSALAIYIFNDIHRNPLVNVGVGVYDTYNMATGLMGDVLSYIRLYALGLSGGMLGSAFNNLSDMVLGGEHATWALPLLWCGALVILIAGHALNIAMSALGAFVHPLRLTFVEYFKNVGYEGRGTAYSPFKER